MEPVNFTTFSEANEDEMRWLIKVMEALKKEKLDEKQ